MTLGQLALIVFGVLVISSEYSTGMIRTSLAAVPQRAHVLLSRRSRWPARWRWWSAMVTSFLTFFLGQALLGAHRASIGDPGVMRAVFGAGLYMTLLVLLVRGRRRDAAQPDAGVSAS